MKWRDLAQMSEVLDVNGNSILLRRVSGVDHILGGGHFLFLPRFGVLSFSRCHR